MERKFIRAWRRIQQKRLWRNRIKRFANQYSLFPNPDIDSGEFPRDWKVYRKIRGMHIYKSTGTPCSCALCRGERYNRRENKLDTRRIIEEQL